MLQVTETEIKNRFALDNPAWESGQIAEQFRAFQKQRAYFDGFMRLVTQKAVRRAVVLMGPRRVGKTVMLQQAIRRLIETGVAPKAILYVSVETPVYTGVPLETLLRYFRERHGHETNARLYVFFDEIQYHKDWEVHLKSLVDTFPNVRFVASGSSAAALRLKSRESGAGRFTDFILPPLTFAEFLRFTDRETFTQETPADNIDIEALNAAFVDYINFGGFPEAVMVPAVRERMNQFIAGDIIDKVLLRDLPSLYGIDDPQELNRLFATLAYNTGGEISLDELSKSSPIAKNTLKKYLEYLEAAFLIRRIYRIDHREGRRFKKQTHFKVYLANPSMRAALFGNVAADDEAMGRLAETAIVSQFAHSDWGQDLFYARWGDREVDLVHCPRALGKKYCWPIEIKWGDRAVDNPSIELKALVDLARGMKTKYWASATTRSRFGVRHVSGQKIVFQPTAYLCWRLSKTLVDERLSKGVHPLTLQPFAISEPPPDGGETPQPAG
jgi:predicted AAA+ superfamily ATPase